jgi:hypothetical protein
MTTDQPDQPFSCPDPNISSSLKTLLDNQQYIRKDVGKVKEHLAEQNHRIDKLEIQNIKEATRAEVDKEWQKKENERIENKTEGSRFWMTTVLALMTLISSGIAIAVTHLI